MPLLRLDYVSPLPPVRSGIADYSLDLLPHLEGLCDLRVVRLPGQDPAPVIAARWTLVDAAETGVGGRVPLYQMGNNRHHLEVWRLAMERPGIVTLHDLALHHLLVERTLAATEDFDAYREELARDHGWVGEVVGRARRWGELGQAPLFELPAHRTLLRRQRGVLVHSAWAAARLAEEDPDLAVRAIPMAVPLPEPVPAKAAAAWRRQRALPADALLLGCFGFQTPIKRTDRVIEALARPELAAAHLVVAGEVAPEMRLEERARAAGVAERVHCLGYLPWEEFSRGIAACDLCVNLRYPTAGETSASLLRILALGRPVLVSDYAQFTDLPEEVAVRVPVGEGEVEALARRVGALLTAPERLDAMARAARRWIAERHDPARAARAVIDACAELAPLAPPGDEAPREVLAPTSLTWSELPGSLEVAGGALPWTPGEGRSLRLRLENRGRARWLSTASGAGGVMVDVHWRDGWAGEPTDRRWVEVPTDLPPGARLELEVPVRRPLAGATVLVVEPHVREVAGFNTLGGPVWSLELS